MFSFYIVLTNHFVRLYEIQKVRHRNQTKKVQYCTSHNEWIIEKINSVNLAKPVRYLLTVENGIDSKVARSSRMHEDISIATLLHFV